MEKRTYKGDCLTGMSKNKLNEEATTVQTFMMCPLLLSKKDVVSMIPVKNMTAPKKNLKLLKC